MRGALGSLLLLCFLIEAAAISKSISQFVRKVTGSEFELDVNPFDDDDYDCKPFSEVGGPGLRAILTTLYGTSLVLFSHHAPHQIHVMTMFRTTGQDKLEKGIRAARKNFRDAKFAIVRRAPSLVMAHRSVKKMNDRVLHHRKIVAETKKAKADGIVTEKEAKKLARLQKRQIRSLKRDMRRLMRAGNSLGAVIQALDFDEIADVGKAFLFQFLAVLSTGHNDTKMGSFISNWCLFLNLGDLILDTNGKLKFPIAKILLRRGGFRKLTARAEQVEATGKFAVYGISGFLVAARHRAARRLNAALLSSAVVVRGIRQLVDTMLAWDNDDDDGPWPAIGRFLEGGSGGLFMLGLTIAGLIARDKVEKGELKPPEWILRPLQLIEKSIEGVATAADKIV